MRTSPAPCAFSSSVLRPAMTATLGPQCYTCRKRQVKCDSNTPACQRCLRDHLECRGYKRPLKIIFYQPPRCRQSRKPPPAEPDRVAENRDGSPSSATELLLYKPSSDRDYLALLESFQYYEVYVLPRLLPTQAPFRRTKVDRDVPWHEVPKIVQHCLIVFFRSMQPDFNAPHPNSRQDLCHYRGLSLSELQEILPDAVTEPYGVALSCILLLMGTDLLLPPFGSWLTHFEAAQRLISLRGGIKRCLRDQPGSRTVLINYVLQDIFTGTTSNSKALGSRYSAQLDYPALLPDITADFVTRGFHFPVVILLAVARTNVLRATSRSSSQGTFRAIWQSIETFAPASWAISIMQQEALCTPPFRPEDTALSETLSGLTCYAKCCQSAGLLYLAFSCPPPRSALIANSLSLAKHDLAANIRLLFDMSDLDTDSPFHTQLWKFIGWPMFISVYARIGWHLVGAGGEDNSSAHAEIDRIRATGAAKGSHRLLIAAEYLHNIHEKRALRQSWRWDDGFSSRCDLFL